MEVLIHKDGLVIYRNKIVGQEDIIVTAEYEFCLMVHIYGLVVYPWAPDRIVEPLWNKQEVDFVEKASIKMPKFVFNKRERTLKKLVKIAQNTTR